MLVDDPELTARTDGAVQPWRIVMGQRSVPPPRGSDARNPPTASGRSPPGTRRSPWRRWSAATSTRCCWRGPALAGSFLRARLIDRVIWYTAPAILAAGTGAVSDLGIGSIDGAWRLAAGSVTRGRRCSYRPDPHRRRRRRTRESLHVHRHRRGSGPHRADRTEGDEAVRLTVTADVALGDTAPGDSIAVNGVCLTVSALLPTGFSADVMPRPCGAPLWLRPRRARR